jgi:hypothetical protein
MNQLPPGWQIIQGEGNFSWTEGFVEFPVELTNSVHEAITPFGRLTPARFCHMAFGGISIMHPSEFKPCPSTGGGMLLSHEFIETYPAIIESAEQYGMSERDIAASALNSLVRRVNRTGRADIHNVIYVSFQQPHLRAV